jgi:PAS domain S-box-containing protein
METIVSRRTGLHQSDDSFLVTTSNLFATQPRLIPDLAVLQIGIHTQAVTNCLLHSSGVLEADDYRGIPVIVVYRWLPSQKMCLIVKIDQVEALAPARALSTTIALVGGLVLLIGAIAAFIISKTFTRPIQQLVTGTEEMGKGNLDYRIGLKSQDEIGLLGKSFDRMAENLKTTLVSRDDLVKEAKIRKKAENKLKETTSYLENLIGSANAPIIVWDSQFRITRFNHAFESLTGRKGDEVIGKTLEMLFPPDQVKNSMALIKEVQKGKRWESVEISIHHINGSDRTVLWNSATIYDNDGKTPVATIAQGQDITERKRAEERLLNTLNDLERSNKELEQFAYVASHDLQEPLRMVASYTQLLEKRYKDKLDSDALEFINYAVAGANRMQALVNDLLSYSRIGTRGKALEPIDAHIALGQARMNLSATIEETHAVVTNDDLPEVMADESQLVQLFQNLIGNAIKFHKADESPRIHISAERKEKQWVFSVRDNGIGIEPQYFERIFVIFQRLNTREEYKGTGIGLAICKKIVERHGGKIWIESQPGEGSTFYFTINIADLKKKNN